VTRTNDRLRLEIEDWGIGFDAATVDGDAFGLQEVRQRVRLLGGEVSVDSVPGKGTRVVVSFPVDEAAPTVIAPKYTSSR
jgi:signal transduction histidine kinase